MGFLNMLAVSLQSKMLLVLGVVNVTRCSESMNPITVFWEDKAFLRLWRAECYSSSLCLQSLWSMSKEL